MFWLLKIGKKKFVGIAMFFSLAKIPPFRNCYGNFLKKWEKSWFLLRFCAVKTVAESTNLLLLAKNVSYRFFARSTANKYFFEIFALSASKTSDSGYFALFIKLCLNILKKYDL